MVVVIVEILVVMGSSGSGSSSIDGFGGGSSSDRSGGREVVVLCNSIQSKEKLTFNSCSFLSSALSGVSRLRTMVCSVRWSTDEGWRQESLTNHLSYRHYIHTYSFTVDSRDLALILTTRSPVM